MAEDRTLYIFADEFGTMPTSDDGDVFVAAAVAMMGLPPATLPKGSHNREWFIQTLHHLKATPVVRFVLPFPGYGRLRRAVVNKLTTMASVTAETSGGNAKYFDPDPGKFNVGNDLWIRAVGEATQAGLFAGVFVGPVERVRLHIDRKTLSATAKAAFLNAVGKNVLRMDGILKAAAVLHPKQGPRVVENLRGCNPEPQVTWVKEDGNPDPPELKNGHRLAHLLAYETGMPLRETRQPEAVDWLVQAGFQSLARNVTPSLVQDINPKTVRGWMAETGEQEPPLEFDDTPPPEKK